MAAASSSQPVALTIPTEISFTNILTAAKDLLFDNLTFFIKLVIAMFLLNMIPYWIIQGIASTISDELGALLSFLIIFWQLFITLGAIKITLKVSRGQEADLKELLEQKPILGKYIWANIRLALQVMLGYILLVIPGIIWTLKYQFVPYLVADKEMDAKEAFEYSARMTNGWKMKLFFYGIGLMLVNLAGALLFGIGLIITIPISYLFSFVMYRALDKRLKASTKTKKATV